MLYGKKRQAVAAKSREWSLVSSGSGSSGEAERKTQSLEAENKELGARIDAVEKKEGAQKGSGISNKEEGDLEEEQETVWKSRMTPSVAENWMN